MQRIVWCGAMVVAAMVVSATAAAAAPSKTVEALVQQHGAGERARIERGLGQLHGLWRASDGDAAEFDRFARAAFAPSGAALDGVLERFREALEALDGHFLEISRALGRRLALDLGPVTPLDERLGAYEPAAHLGEDLFANKVALTALINFPLTTLAERLAGVQWSRRQWAEVRLASRFSERIPAAVAQKLTAASAAAELYIARYNIYMHHLVVDGRRPFPKGLELISHWNLRDQIKADYATNDVAAQRLVAKVMERIVDQSIPRAVIDNPAVDWNPFTNQVSAAPAAEIEPGAQEKPGTSNKGDASSAREPDTRYQVLLDTFHAARAADRYVPTAPTLIARSFERGREIPEERFVAAMKEILTSPLVPKVAALVTKRLGRPLQPFDLWYDGFRARAAHPEAELDALVRKRYPTAAAYHDDIPRLLMGLGFTKERARFFADHIVVDPARGAGHALQSERRGDDPHLRTRIEPGGMNYKGFNIAVHEMGHNVEQICSLYLVDDWLLHGVPNMAFTEALAFLFQVRDLELLGLGKPDPAAVELRTLAELWTTYELAGVALVDLEVWRWMYAHPSATAAELRAAVVAIARRTWNDYYAPVLGTRDALLLGVYSHMISSFLYLPDYPLGHLIAAQIEEHMRTHGPLGAELERMASFGRLPPDLWMQHATGEPVSAAALLRMAAAALAAQK